MAAHRNGQDLNVLLGARNLIDAGRHEDAGIILHDWLKREPEDGAALFLLARTLIDTDKTAIALPILEKATAVAPERYENWMALGGALLSMQLFDKAAAALQAAYQLAPRSHVVLQLLSHWHLNTYRLGEALAFADESLSARDNPEAHIAKGFAHLLRREWKLGWPEYIHGLGHDKTRTRKEYGYPTWAGESGPVLIYGEQGPGDQIAYAAALPANTAALNCMPKLATLLGNSLPCAVYGGQYDASFACAEPVSYQASMSEAMQYTVADATALPRPPYLKPTAEKVLQWQALYRSLGERPKIGLAWNGGTVGTAGWRTRSLPLDAFLPVFELGDVISLEYKDDHAAVEEFKARTGQTVHRFPWGARSRDLDDVAAMIAGLDAVVCVPTTAYHIAGGLGIPAQVIVHDKPHFWEGVDDTRSPWWDSVRWYRRPVLADATVRHAVQALSEVLHA